MVVTDRYEYLCEEEKRLKEDRERKKYWKQFGSYVQIPESTCETFGLTILRCLNDNGRPVGVSLLQILQPANVRIR